MVCLFVSSYLFEVCVSGESAIRGPYNLESGQTEYYAVFFCEGGFRFGRKERTEINFSDFHRRYCGGNGVLSIGQ